MTLIVTQGEAPCLQIYACRGEAGRRDESGRGEVCPVTVMERVHGGDGSWPHALHLL